MQGHCLICEHHTTAPLNYPIDHVGCKVNAQNLKPTIKYTPVVLGVGSAPKITEDPDYFDPADLVEVCGRFVLKQYSGKTERNGDR